MKKCPNCGKEVDDDLAEEGICSNCGEEFNPEEAEENNAKENETDE